MPRKSVRVARVGLFGHVKPPSQITRAGGEFTPLYRFVHIPFVQSLARSVRQRAIPQGTRGGCYVVRPLCNCCTRYARPADVAALLDRCSTRRVDCDAGGAAFPTTGCTIPATSATVRDETRPASAHPRSVAAYSARGPSCRRAVRVSTRGMYPCGASCVERLT